MNARAEGIEALDSTRTIRDAVERNLALLDALARLTACVDDDCWSAALPEDPANTLGAQCRHLLDHYDSLLSGALTGAVDYADRQRGRACERSRRAAHDRSAGIRRELTELARGIDAVLVVRDDDGNACRTSLGRELDFLASHSTHHLALMRLLARIHGVALDPELGVAASTRSYRAPR